MKTFFAVLLMTTALLQGVPVLAGSPGASPLIGSWAVDVSRLPMPPAARPRSVTLTFGETDDGKWTTQVDIVDASGEESHARSVATLDGTATPVESSPEADIAALKMPQPGVLVMMLGKGGIAASTRVYAAAADGGTMVETAAYFGADGVPLMRTNYFKRVR